MQDNFAGIKFFLSPKMPSPSQPSIFFLLIFSHPLVLPHFLPLCRNLLPRPKTGVSNCFLLHQSSAPIVSLFFGTLLEFSLFYDAEIEKACGLAYRKVSKEVA